MKCVFCHAGTMVTDKRDSPEGVRRRRECLKCRKRFTTYEKPEFKDIIIVKKDKRREKFSREKLKRGIEKACEKRPVSTERIDKLVADIEEKLRSSNGEVKSEVLGKIVMDKLKKIDKVAYIRFASVYREFQDLKDFKLAMKQV